MPSDPFYVPYHGGLQQLGLGTADPPFVQDAGAGLLGTTHTERGLTFVTVQLAGHGKRSPLAEVVGSSKLTMRAEIPQYSPGSGYRQLEFLLGRIDSLTVRGDYTTYPGNFTGTSAPSPSYSNA